MNARRPNRSHVEYYRGNRAYADRIAEHSDTDFRKYLAWLGGTDPKGKRVLDFGCGTGQVVHELSRRGAEAVGLEVSDSSLKLARKGPGNFRQFSGTKIPFPDGSFDTVGSFTVLEHVDDPAAALREMIRVLAPGGTIVTACPNFLRVVGLSTHHPHNTGIANQARNAVTLAGKLIRLWTDPAGLRFGRMDPIERDGPFQSDDDAIAVTNAVDVLGVWRVAGVRKAYQSSLLYPASASFERLSRLPLVRTVTGGVFLVGRRGEA